MNILILLIGTNPLPNYVIGRYFTEVNAWADHIILVHAEQNDSPHVNQASTANEASAIVASLGLNPDKFTRIPLSDVSDIEQIMYDLEHFTLGGIGRIIRLPQWLSSATDIHVNFTGGTKSMTLGVYSYFKMQVNGRDHLEFSSSYLNARNDMLVVGEGEYLPGTNSRAIKLKENVSLNSINTLIDLHSYERLENLERGVDQVVFNAFKDELNKTRLAESFRSFTVNKNTLPVALSNLFEKDAGIKEKTPLEPILSRFRGEGNNPHIKNFIEILHERISHNDYNKLSSSSKNTVNVIFNRLKYLGDNSRYVQDESHPLANQFRPFVETFCNTTYLEYWVDECIRKMKDTITGVTELGMNVEAVKKGADRQTAKFELDNYFLHGHRLFAISVTSSGLNWDTSKLTVKAKGFEVIHRARQIGGDESIAILVCRAPKNRCAQIRSTLSYSTGTTESRFHVFGYEDWYRLTDCFRELVIQ